MEEKNRFPLHCKVQGNPCPREAFQILSYFLFCGRIQAYDFSFHNQALMHLNSKDKKFFFFPKIRSTPPAFLSLEEKKQKVNCISLYLFFQKSTHYKSNSIGTWWQI